MALSLHPYTLRFKFPAGTSQKVLKQKTSYFLQWEGEGYTAQGEAGPLDWLSPEYLFRQKPHKAFLRALERIGEEQFAHWVEELRQNGQLEHFFQMLQEMVAWVPASLPAFRFALETLLLDAAAEGRKDFFELPTEAVPINGLIWMGKPEDMRRQIEEKLAQGYTCLKLKIGALRWQEELQLLRQLRERFGPEQLTLRVDANGAFSPQAAFGVLEALDELAVHSIEQPIAPGQPEWMAELAQASQLRIALDEELIGLSQPAQKEALLERAQADALILKPTLLGGFCQLIEWIGLAEERGLEWWLTSALESNIGLNAIARFTALWQPELHQGLGTGHLFTNNFPAPLRVEGGQLYLHGGPAWQVALS